MNLYSSIGIDSSIGFGTEKIYIYCFIYSAKQKLHEHTQIKIKILRQTRKRQNRTTHISSDLRKAHSDIARDLNLENKNKEIVLDF